ncbi:MAG: S8 family peptidase [Gammaproteobacteria bacterium]|nr:S8 family peptidase [Gammaproteobacteria bacterium]
MSDESRPHLKLKEHKPLEDRTFSGGGGGTYQRTEYKQHANKIFKEAQILSQFFEKSMDHETTKKRYFRIELPEETNILASSEGKKISDAVLGNLVGAPAKNIGHFSTIETSFSALLEQIKTYNDSDTNVGKSKFAPIENISSIPAKEKISVELENLIENKKYSGEILITLFSDLSREEQEGIKKSINLYLLHEEGQIIGEVDTSQGKLLRVKAKPESISDLAKQFISIQSIDPIEEVIIESSRKGEKIEDQVTVMSNESKASVCIFDSGVTKNSRFLEGSIIGYEEPIGPPHNNDHGTFVASRIIYGNSLRDAISKGQLNPDTKVLSVCMISHDDIGNRRPARGDEFLKIIRDTVERWHQKIKVYNISMNLTNPNVQEGAIVTDDSVGGVAAEIDSLSRKYNVLFILTTGNYPVNLSNTPTEPYPDYFHKDDNRMLRPGEAMLALTVGSIADRENEGSMAKSSAPSPFTRKGPGFNTYRKPDVVAQGGNFANNWREFDELSVAGIGGSGDHLSYGNGTSFAAPLISRLAAKTFEYIENATPELVRALLIHSANLAESESFDSEMAQKLMGNGLPDTTKLLTSDRWNQNYIYQGVIGYRKIIKIPFYVPKTLIDRKGGDIIRIRFTLAFSPETNRTLKAGYCKSHLRTQLSKLNKDNTLIPISSDETNEALKDRYSTVIRYDKTFSRGVAAGDWEILIEQQSRWTLSETDTPFAVVLQISDPRNDAAIDIYSAIQAEVPNKYENLVTLKERLKI